ncbi:retrovirus-related pol polyprotein from transposon TNT 1-94 [Tanacetum coccineum]
MSINHEKYTLVIVDEYTRMVENQNDRKVKQIRIDNGTEFRNHELESFCDERGISQNFYSPYTPKQNGVAERKNRTLIEAARTMLNRSVLSKHFWTEAVRIACYTQNRSIIVKRHDKTPYEIFRERIYDIWYPSRQYQVDFDISYYVIPYGRSLSELTQDNQVPKVIALSEPDIPHTEDTEGKNTRSPRILWSRDQHIELVNIIGDPGEAMLTRSMAAKLTVALASECIFADFLFEIEPKKVSEALKHSGWIDAMQEELNQFYRNIVWTLVPLPYGKTTIGSKWFEKLMTKKFEMIIMGELTYFLGLQIKQDDKGVSIFQEQYTRNLLKKYEISNSSSVKTPMVPPKNLGLDLASKYQSNPKESHLIIVKRILRCCQILGGKLVCGSAKKQQLVVMSSAKTEYVAAAGCYCHCIIQQPHPCTQEPSDIDIRDTPSGSQP